MIGSSASPGSVRPPVATMGGSRWRRWAPWALLLLGLAGSLRDGLLWRELASMNQAIRHGVPAPLAPAGAASAAPTASSGTGDMPAAEAPPQPVSGDDLASAPSSAPSAPKVAPVPAWLNDGRPLSWRFAQAVALTASGDDEGALARYRSMYDDPAVGLAARYNAANLLLRQGIDLRAGPSPGAALPLLELAKEGYRQVLRQSPHHLAARYNLERAQRLQPEVDEDELAGAAPENAERAATTMRGVSQGLP